MRTATVKGIAALALSMLATGCLRDELPVPKVEMAGEVVTACIGSMYQDQIWFDLSTNTEVSRNPKTAWDLAFESTDAGWRIRLNPARFMTAQGTGQTDITQPTDTTGYGGGWRIDAPSGHPDSTAIGDRRNSDEVIAVDMGYDQYGGAMGVRKIQVLGIGTDGFHVRYARLNGSNMGETTLPRDPARRFVHFKFSSGSLVEVAPPDGAYDLVFTQFTTQFYEPFMPYLVTGIVNGFSGLRVAKLTNNDLGAVSLDDTLQHPFSVREDAIGYDWKVYNGVGYTILTDQVFIITTAVGERYKLRFVDFINESGERGCPKFEVIPFQ